MVDAEDLVRSIHRSAQEAATKALSVTTGEVAFEKMQADAADAGKGRGKAPRELLTRPGLPGSAEEVSGMLECWNAFTAGVCGSRKPPFTRKR